ncbi:Bug family tripartite tricarboxylate transporter substrate binding protein [Zwartia panacis]|uniref:Bug family tripartite tricarboxylate transporter substrate binding protein n=1 Tax=Zwartia panacis TaxID=2683345 RepID=UPI0025B3F62B|nr:tripartite tricarboxylate transporter substrate binding protein [Zwartia panacis]MDN4017518.1 tripartite tricarboxylate transporter substrate binding protein [Zwartia panacis]
MNFRRLNARGLFVALGVFAGMTQTSVNAQTYPTRSITLVVPYSPGGSTDPVARQYATQLQKALGVDVTIENKPGGSGTIGTGMVVRAKPDGYTLGLATNSILAYQPLVNQSLAFKTPDQYQPIVKLGSMPVILVVRADAPWQNFSDFVQYVKQHPGKVRASVSGLRTVPDLVAQEFNKTAGTKLRTVPFTGGSGEALVALLGNRVEATLFTGAVGIPSHVQAGKVRVLAVFDRGTYSPVPEAQSTIDAGFNTTLAASFYIIGPKGMPSDVLSKLSKVSMEIVNSPEFKKFSETGYALDPKGPDALSAEIIRDTKTFDSLLKEMDQK